VFDAEADALGEQLEDQIVDPQRHGDGIFGVWVLPRRIGSDKAKVGLIAAGGLASLTAASAGISSLRRRLEGPQGDS